MGRSLRGCHVRALAGTDQRHFRQILNRHVSPERGRWPRRLLGTRESLSYEEQQRFLLTGTIHLLAISRMNLAILAWGIDGLVRLLGLSRPKGDFAGGRFRNRLRSCTGGEPPVVAGRRDRRRFALGTLVPAG